MKASTLISILLFILLTIRAIAQGILIDHNCTDLSQIPANVIDDVQENIRFHYAHTSHGEQLLCGLDQIEISNGVYDVEIGGDIYDPLDPPFLPNVPGALCIYNGNDGYKYIVPEGYWLEPGIDYTISTLNNNPTINVSGWMWCTQLDTISEAGVQEYFDAMEAFELQFPNVTFIYFTGNAQGGGIYDPETGYNRHLRCNQIRQYCAENNKILFDFENIDCWYNGEMNYYIYNDDTIPMQHSAYNGDECGHVNGLSCIQKGNAVWWMMARLRGWQPGSRSLNIKVFLEGNYNGIGLNTAINQKGIIPLSQPFNIPPINYNGSESVMLIPGNNIVDWIYVELRDAADAQSATEATLVMQRAAFLLNDGHIVDLDGYSNIPFNNYINQELFLVIRQRSHLGIMSSNPLSESNNEYSYDFTVGLGKAYGGPNSQKQLTVGIWGMISGDGNQDGIINENDKSEMWNPDSGLEGYSPADYDLNGNVDNKDKNQAWFINFNKISYIP
jgi:hypothetical protein